MQRGIPGFTEPFGTGWQPWDVMSSHPPHGLVPGTLHQPTQSLVYPRQRQQVCRGQVGNNLDGEDVMLESEREADGLP